MVNENPSSVTNRIGGSMVNENPSSVTLVSVKKKSSHKAVGDIMAEMLKTMNGRSPKFVNFTSGILTALSFSYYEIIGMFESAIIKPPSDESLFEISEHDLRQAWMRTKDPSSQGNESEAEWFFCFCIKLGFSHLQIIKMMHERID
jgi:hypothetical protein